MATQTYYTIYEKHLDFSDSIPTFAILVSKFHLAMNINQKVAIKIHELRTQKNILQTAVADHLNMSQNAYSMLENGFTRITIQKLYDLSIFFQVPITDLLDLSENIYQDSSVCVQKEVVADHHSIFYERIIEGLNKTIAMQNEIIVMLKKR